MLPEDLLDVASLRDSFLFANTPAFLFKRFRKDSAIQTVGMTFAANRVEESLWRLLPEMQVDVDSATKFYALLVALTFRDATEVYQFYTKLIAHGVKWVKEICQFHLQLAESFFVEVCSPKSIVAFEARGAFESATTIVNVPYIPHLTVTSD